jgi:hypothetical protein
VNRGAWTDAQMVNICTASMKAIRNDILEELQRQMTLKLEATDKQPFQTAEYYSVDNYRVSETFIQILLADDGKPPVTVGVIGLSAK